MDNIWDSNSFEVGGHWALWRGCKKPNDHAEPTKVERQIEIKKKSGQGTLLVYGNNTTLV